MKFQLPRFHGHFNSENAKRDILKAENTILTFFDNDYKKCSELNNEYELAINELRGTINNSATLTEDNANILIGHLESIRKHIGGADKDAGEVLSDTSTEKTLIDELIEKIERFQKEVLAAKKK